MTWLTVTCLRPSEMSHHIYDHAHRVISIYRLCTVSPKECNRIEPIIWAFLVCLRDSPEVHLYSKQLPGLAGQSNKQPL